MPTKRVLGAFAVSVLVALAFVSPVIATDRIKVCFSPPNAGGCDPTQTIVEAMNAARSEILVQAYSFTSAPIAKAVVGAERRGVRVQVILDKSNERVGYSAAMFLKNSGVPVLIDSAHAIAHNKIMIIDGQTVVTGSFNFTKAAEESNAENLLVIHDPELAKLYLSNWKDHAAHSQPYATVDAPRSGSGEYEKGRDEAKERENGRIVGNRRSHIYVWPGCASYDTMAPQNRTTFPTAEAAEAAGYRAARNCP